MTTRGDLWSHPPELDEPETQFRRTWQPVDLGDALDGDVEPAQPTVGRRTDGRGLFYPGRCHAVAAETEAGKTWLSLSAALDEMRAGHHVLYVDFEDEHVSMVGRLMTLGADRAQVAERFHYLRPEDALGTGINLDDLLDVVTTYRPSLAVIDGITEAMTMHGLNPLDNGDAARFGRILPRRIADMGPAVASLDHVTKDREGRGRYAIGAVHKLNGLNGASYLLDNRSPFGVGLTGRSTLRIAKDRPGQLRAHGVPSAGGQTWYADLVLTSHAATFADVALEPPVELGEFRPTLLMGRVAEALTEHGPLAQRRICAAVSGKATSVRSALDYLILDGYVSEATPHQLLRPYVPEVDVQ